MTRFDSPADLRDEVPRLDRASRSWVTAVLLGVAVVLVGFGYLLVAFVLALGPALAFIYGGFVYGVIGTVIITIRWITVPREGSTGPADRVRVTEVHRFGTGAQGNTLILNIVLLLNLGAFFLTPSSSDDFTRGDGIIWGAIAQVAGLALIIVNWFWAFQPRYILGEHDAMTHRIGRYRLIAVNRGLSYLVWLLHTATAGYLAISAAVTRSSPLDLFLT